MPHLLLLLQSAFDYRRHLFTGSRCTALVLLLVLGIPAAVRAQAPFNDEPCRALALPYSGSTCTLVGGTTVGATTTAGPFSSTAGSCDPIPALNDVWFIFTYGVGWPANTTLTLTAMGAAAADVRVFRAPLVVCADPTSSLTQIACSRAPNASSPAPAIVMPNTPGTYYVRVAGFDASSPGGTFTLCRSDNAAPTCQSAPTVLTSSGTYTPTTATIQYVPNLPVQVTMTRNGGTPQTSLHAASPLRLTGLTENTDYSLNIVSVCTAIGQVSPPTTVTIRTPLSSRYCTSALGGNCLFNTVGNVQIPGTTLNYTSGCNGSADGAYTGVPPTNPNQTATLQRNQTYQLRVTTTSNPGAGTSGVAFWIDYDNNGVFDASEYTLFPSSVSPSAPGLVSFTVPATATPGFVGMRIRSWVSGSTPPAPGGACSNLSSQYGETEDYTLVIDQALPVRNAALAAQVELYPNPAHHSFALRLPAALSAQPLTAELLNTLGQVVSRRYFAAAPAGLDTSFDVRGLPTGIYTLRLHLPGGPLSKRVIVD